MINEISIKNFKSIEKTTIQLKNLNIFIGANNSGKSNLLEALEMYQRLLVVDSQEVFGPGPYSFPAYFFRGSDINKDSINLKISYQNTKPIIHEFELCSEHNKGKGPRFILTLKNEQLITDNYVEKNSNSSSLLLKQKATEKSLDSSPIRILLAM